MKRKKFFATVLAAVMVLSSVPFGTPTVVHAAENDIATELNVEFVDSLEGIAEEALHTVSAEELVQEHEMQPDKPFNLTISEEGYIGEFQSSKVNGISTYSSVNSITQSFSDTIEEEGGIRYLMVTLAPGEILQATLANPNNANIDYDLLLYTYNDGLDTRVAASMLSTYINTYNNKTTKTVEDGISYINTGAENQTYALIICATAGYSSTETFTLTVSIDEKGYYDSAEPNDSPFTAVTIPTGVKITGNNLNVSNDQDWFVWNVPSSIDGVSVSLSNSAYTAEVYYASGASMILVNPNSNGIYKLNPGYHYIRVYNLNNSFTSSDYTLTLQPYGNKASTIKVTFDGDMGSNKAYYPEGPYNIFERTMTPSALVLDSLGYPVIYETVTLTWLSESWNEWTGNSTRSQSELTDSSGIARFNLTVPTSLGYHSFLSSGPITTRPYYDIDGIVFICENASVSQIVYHFQRSDYISS